MFGLGFGEILIIVFFGLIFIGPKKLPELAKGLGRGMRDFQDAMKGLENEVTTRPSKQPQEEVKSEFNSNVIEATIVKKSETDFPSEANKDTAQT